MKKKLKLSEIAVKSFITAETIKGGAAATLLNIACIHPPIPTDPVIGCDPRASIPTNCTCSGMYPSLNMPCPTLDIEC